MTTRKELKAQLVEEVDAASKIPFTLFRFTPRRMERIPDVWYQGSLIHCEQQCQCGGGCPSCLDPADAGDQVEHPSATGIWDAIWRDDE